VPIARNLVRGPEFNNETIYTKLEEFLLSNTQLIEKVPETIGKNADEFNKCLMYFEGCCIAYSKASPAA
jgi:hypothetical protein